MTNIEKLLNPGTVRSIAEVLANVCELCAGCGYRLDDDSCGAGWIDCVESWEAWLKQEAKQ